MTSNEGSTVLWISNLSETVRPDDVISLFEKYGPVHEVQIKGAFCKVEFENRGDAKKARHGLDSVDFHGRRLSVDWFRGNDNDEPLLLQGRNWWGGRPGKPRFRYRVYILNLPNDIDHSKLLHLAWEAGNSVVFLDVIPCPFDEQTFVGIIEYAHEMDYKYALDYLDGMSFRQQKLRWISEEQYNDVEKRLGHRTRPLHPVTRPSMVPIPHPGGIPPTMRPPPTSGGYIPQPGMNSLLTGTIGYTNGIPPPPPPPPLGPNPTMMNPLNSYGRYENNRGNESTTRYRYNVPMNTQNIGTSGQGPKQGNLRMPWQ